MLAGIAIGFILVNRGERGICIFRDLNSSESLIYVFFTLADILFELQVLNMTGLIGVYFVARIRGKILGACRGRVPLLVQKSMEKALIFQGGIVVSFIFFLASDATLAKYLLILAPVGLTGVFLFQLIVSFCTRFAVIRAGEAPESVKETAPVIYNWACELHLKLAKGGADCSLYGLPGIASSLAGRGWSLWKV